MKNISFYFMPILVSIFIFSCGKENNVSIPLNQEFELGFGKNAIIEDAGVTVRFQEILTDSRCPRGNECVWEGAVDVELLITLENGDSYPVQLSTSTKLLQPIDTIENLVYSLEEIIRPKEVGGLFDTKDKKYCIGLKVVELE